MQDAVDAVGILAERGVDAQLDVVGDAFPGYEWMVEDLTRRIDDAGTGDRVRLRGFDPEIWPHLARADVLVVPSRLDEPFGNVAVEGALAARPLIVSRTSGLIEAADGFDFGVRGAAVGPAGAWPTPSPPWRAGGPRSGPTRCGTLSSPPTATRSRATARGWPRSWPPPDSDGRSAPRGLPMAPPASPVAAAIAGGIATATAPLGSVTPPSAPTIPAPSTSRPEASWPVAAWNAASVV